MFYRVVRAVTVFLATFFLIQTCLAETPQVLTQKPPMLVPATEEELQGLIQSVDLSGWSGMAYYLWTCTPRYFILPMFNAKNEMKNAFDQFKKDKKILTLMDATRIATRVSKPLNTKIPGLSGIMCRVNIAISNVEKPYFLHCLFIMLDARYLSRLATDVANNSGKKEVVPEDTINAIQKLLDANCQKSNNNDDVLWRGEWM